MIKVSRDHEQEKQILSIIKSFLHKHSNRNEDTEPVIHVSSLLWCLRKSYYQLTDPNIIITDEEAYKFFKGNVSESVITNMLYKSPLYKKQDKIQGYGVVSHPDVIQYENDGGGLVIELKQTDRYTAVNPTDEKYNSFISYATQLLYYMCITGIKKGQIIINHSLLKENPYQVWNIECDESDFEIIKKDISFKRNLLYNALKKKNVGLLPKLSTIGNGVDKCNMCNYSLRCKRDMDLWTEVDQSPLINKENLKKTDVSYLYKTLNVVYG